MAQSLIEARVNVQGDKSQPWGLASIRTHAESNGPLAYVDDVCEQLLEIERRLQSQLSSVARDRYLELKYEDFCTQPVSTLEQVAANVGDLRIDEELVSAELTPFAVSASLRLSRDEIQRIEQRLANSPILRPHFVDNRRSVPS